MPPLPAFHTVLVGYAPLPPPYLDALRTIEVETSTESAGMFRLHFELSQTVLGDYDALQIDIFRPLLPVQVRVSLGNGLSEPLINGYVKEASLRATSTPGASTLDIVGMDAGGTLMNLQDRIMPWPNLPDSVIALSIFGQYGMLPAVIPTSSVRVILETTTVQRGTDIGFLKQLARRNGYECFIQPDPVVGIDIGHFGPPRLMAPPQAVLSVNFGPATNLEQFDVAYDMLQPTAALAVAMDARTKAPLPAVAPAALEAPMGLEPTLARILPPPMVRPAGTDAANAGELTATAASIASRSSRAIRGSGAVDGFNLGRALRPGLPILVRGAGRQHSGLYYVTEVTHSLSTEGYSQRFTAWRNAVGLTGAEVFVDPMAALG